MNIKVKRSQKMNAIAERGHISCQPLGPHILICIDCIITFITF